MLLRRHLRVSVLPLVGPRALKRKATAPQSCLRALFASGQSPCCLRDWESLCSACRVRDSPSSDSLPFRASTLELSLKGKSVFWQTGNCRDGNGLFME